MIQIKEGRLKKIKKTLDNGYCVVYVQVNYNDYLTEFMALTNQMKAMEKKGYFKFRQGSGVTICDTYCEDGEYIMSVERIMTIIELIED